MATRAKYRLNKADQAIIGHAVAHDKRPEVVKRATAIRLLHLGYQVQEIARMLVVDRGSIYGWHRRWRKGGLEGLANHPRSGRPRKAGGNYREILEQTLAQAPAEAGYDFAIWTIERLRQHMLDETGIDLSN